MSRIDRVLAWLAGALAFLILFGCVLMRDADVKRMRGRKHA